MAAEGRPSNAPGAGPAPPEVLGVALGEDEEVRWIWTHTPGGESVVTGYTIVKKGGDGGSGSPAHRCLAEE